MRQNTGYRRGDNLVGFGRDGDRRRYAKEDQQRCHQEPATDTEQAGQEPDTASKADDDSDMHRNFGDGEIDVHDHKPRKTRTASRTLSFEYYASADNTTPKHAAMPGMQQRRSIGPSVWCAA